MKKQIRVLLTLLVGVAAMLGLALSGASAASAATTGAQNFTILSVDPSASANPVVANGVIHARGVDHARSGNLDIFRFARGALFVVHHSVSSSNQVDPVTCLGRYNERGTYQIFAGSRTYRGASGRGVYSVNTTFVEASTPSGRCLANRPPVLFQEVVQARGNISLPQV